MSLGFLGPARFWGFHLHKQNTNQEERRELSLVTCCVACCCREFSVSDTSTSLGAHSPHLSPSSPFTTNNISKQPHQQQQHTRFFYFISFKHDVGNFSWPCAVDVFDWVRFCHSQSIFFHLSLLSRVFIICLRCFSSALFPRSQAQTATFTVVGTQLTQATVATHQTMGTHAGTQGTSGGAAGGIGNVFNSNETSQNVTEKVAAFEEAYLLYVLEHHFVGIRAAALCLQSNHHLHPSLQQLCRYLNATEQAQYDVLNDWLQFYYGRTHQPSLNNSSVNTTVGGSFGGASLNLSASDAFWADQLNGLQNATSDAEFEARMLRFLVIYRSSAIVSAAPCAQSSFHKEFIDFCISELLNGGANLAQVRALLCGW